MTSDTRHDPLAKLSAQGMAVWLDDLSRELLASGELQSLITGRHVVGVTTNPTIFASALANGDRYDAQLSHLAELGASTEAAIFTVTTDDVRAACDVLSPVYRQTVAQGGRVSIEVDPRLARDAAATADMARALRSAVDRDNMFVCRLGRGESRADETQRSAVRPVTPQRPRRAGTAPAGRRRQGSRSAYPADASGHRQAAGPRAPRRAHVPGAAPSRPARRTPGPSRGAGHQLLTAGQHRRSPGHTGDHPRPRTRRQAVRARRHRVRPRPVSTPGVESRRRFSTRSRCCN
jgi:Transaldolase/Fructose-6-phosphate aldolase